MADTRSEKHIVRTVRRLSVEGLPLSPFVHTLVDTLSPSFPLTMMPLILNIDNPVRGIFPHVDMSRWGRHFKHYRSLPARETGVVTYAEFFAQWKTVVPQERYFQNNFLESKGYNEFYRLIDVHHCAGILLRGLGTGICHLFSFARGKDMPSFSTEEHRLLHRIAPYLDHAVSVAEAREYRSGQGEPDLREIHDDRDQDFPPGMVLLSERGKVLGMDDRALELLSRWTTLDGNPSPIRDENLRGAFRAMAKTLISLSDPATDPMTHVPSPVMRLLTHATGLTILLRGFHFLPLDRKVLFGVQVVESVPMGWRRIRMRSRYGLSVREGEVLEHLALDRSFKEIASDLGISNGALSTYIVRLQEKNEGVKLEDLKRGARKILLGRKGPSG